MSLGLCGGRLTSFVEQKCLLPDEQFLLVWTIHVWEDNLNTHCLSSTRSP